MTSRRDRDRKRQITVGAGEFKSHCLRLMDEVASERKEIVITKHGRPVAKLVPADDELPDSFGALSGTVRYLSNDLIAPDPEAWDDNPI